MSDGTGRRPATARRIARGLRRAVDDLVLGATCAACGVPGSPLCDRCRADLEGLPGLVTSRTDGLTVVACGHYQGDLARLVVAYKDRGVRSLGAQLARVGARSASARWPSGRDLVLVPVPSSPAAVRRRGYDHMRVFARLLAGELTSLGRPARVLPRLVRARRVDDQADLGQAERVVNQRHSMRWRGRPPTAPVIVVDDILTTGATLGEARRAIEAAGGSVALGLVVAETPLRGPAGQRVPGDVIAPCEPPLSRQ